MYDGSVSCASSSKATSEHGRRLQQRLSSKSLVYLLDGVMRSMSYSMFFKETNNEASSQRSTHLAYLFNDMGGGKDVDVDVHHNPTSLDDTVDRSGVVVFLSVEF